VQNNIIELFGDDGGLDLDLLEIIALGLEARARKIRSILVMSEERRAFFVTSGKIHSLFDDIMHESILGITEVRK
jgi:hypothetical protein